MLEVLLRGDFDHANYHIDLRGASVEGVALKS